MSKPKKDLATKALEEVLTFFDGSYKKQIVLLERELREKIAKQDFDAAAVIRDDRNDVQKYWSQVELRKRIMYALGRD